MMPTRARKGCPTEERQDEVCVVPEGYSGCAGRGVLLTHLESLALPTWAGEKVIRYL